MENQANKVFVISLDGATWDVLRPLMAQGCLPNLRHMLQSSLTAELESVVPPVTAPAWTSFMTGKNPSKHGIFDFTRFDGQDYQWKLNNSQHIRSKTVWQILSEKGKRVVVLNLPYTYPTYPVNGVMVSGWDAPTMSSFTYPEELGKKIFEIIPDYGSTLDLSLWNYLPADSDTEFDRFTDKLLRSFEQGKKLATHFLNHEQWDVFMVHFQQTDWIQHKLWGYIERACANGNDKSPRLERVRECYRTFDRHVGELLGEVAPLKPTTIILSDHGFGASRGSICPNHLLNELGYYQLEQQADNPLKSLFKHSRFGFMRKLYRSMRNTKNSLQGREAVKKFKSWADMANDTIPRQKVPIDWSRTKAVLAAGSENAFIYVNLIGRGPLGCVQPGEEYERLVSELIAKFLEIRHPRTREKLIVKAARGSDIYFDVADGVLLPDIVLVPVEGYGFSSMLSDIFVQESGEEGCHRHNGVVFLQGPELMREVKNFRPNLIDITPTVLHLIGLPVPADMDGRVLEEIFVQPPDVRYEDVDNSVVKEAQEYTGEEAELIEQRLKGLGYVE